MSEEQFGDLFVRKSPSDQGGFDIYVIEPQTDEYPPVKRRVCFFNERGALRLAEWITENIGDKRYEPRQGQE